MAVKRVIVMAVSSNGTELNASGVMWFPITSGARPQTGGSQWIASGSSSGASTAENTAIQNGSIYEEPFGRTFPIATPAATMEAVLQQAWTLRNTQINGIGSNIYYGVNWDGTTWAQG